MGRVERDRELARTRKRRAKLQKIRKKIAAAKSDATKRELISKARRISPFANFEETAAK